MEQTKIWNNNINKNNNIDYLIDPIFGNIKRLSVFLFKNGDNDPKIYYLIENYMPLVEIEDFSALINNKAFFVSK